MDSRRLSFPVDRPRVHSAGLSSPPPLLITTTTSPPACLRRRRLVPPPTRLAYYAAAVGRLRLHRRPASVAADWCLRLHGWPIMPPLLGVYDFTAGLPPSPPSGASAYTAGLLCCCCWASTLSPPACLRRRRVVPPPTRLAYYAAAVGRLRFHRRPASVAADWCLRLHGWPIMPPLLGVYDFTAGLPPSPPIGASAYTAGLLCRRCWASTTSPPACLRRRRVVPPPTRLAYYAAAVGRLRLHRRPASVAADWCLRLHGRPIMPPLLGVYDFTAGLPPSPPSGASAYTAGLLCRRCWASTTSPPACLRRRRLVSPPIRSVGHTTVDGHRHLHRRPASVAADWCLRLHGWPIMPPLLGVFAFTVDRLRRRRLVSSLLLMDNFVPTLATSAITKGNITKLRMDQSEHHHRLASTAADWCFRLHGWPIMPPLLGVYVFTDRLAFAAADWCFRLHGWPIMPPLLGAYVFTDRLAFAAADWCFRLHGWPLCRRCWASTSSPTGLPSPLPIGASACTARLYAAVVGRLRLHRPACLRRRRLVVPPARLAFMPPLLGVYVFTDRPPRPPPTGVYVFTDRLAFVAADWYPRLHGWPIMPPLLGAYVFTDRLAFVAADWCPRLHGWPLCRRCWASTSSPTGRLVRRRLVLPPARLAFMPPLLGVYVFTDRPPRPPPTGASACTAGLLCRRCWAPTSSPTGLPSSPPTDVLACTAGLYAAVVGRLRLHRPACLRRRRPMSSPARLAFMPPLLGVYVFTDRLAFVAADRCPRLHGWPLCRRCWASTSSPTGLPSPPPTGVSACTAGLYAAVVGRLRLHRPAAASAADWCHRLHGWPVITPTDAIFFTAGYIAVTTNRHQYLQHKLPTFAMAADWFLHFHGCMILPVLIGLTIFIAGHLLPLLMDIIVFRRRLVLCRRRPVLLSSQLRLHYRFTSSRQHNFVIMVERLHLYYLRNQQTLLLLLHKFCYITNHDVVVNLDISACDAVLFYYNKWLSNIQDFYLDIFNTYLQSSNDYSTTRSYNSRLYVQLFPN
uniref:cysteine dioxygenase n=1 Tax=Oryza sativa subsp. japonica TaxID=39947 RepID=Q7XTE1_ORYSJ|nr:OSJNBb0022F16.4 [Oryza sativa Japonica Group]